MLTSKPHTRSGMTWKCMFVSSVLALGLMAPVPHAADHLDAPFVKLDGRVDINDLYVFHPFSESSLTRTSNWITLTRRRQAAVSYIC
jgi:hypothetical protein